MDFKILRNFLKWAKILFDVYKFHFQINEKVLFSDIPKILPNDINKYAIRCQLFHKLKVETLACQLLASACVQKACHLALIFFRKRSFSNAFTPTKMFVMIIRRYFESMIDFYSNEMQLNYLSQKSSLRIFPNRHINWKR